MHFTSANLSLSFSNQQKKFFSRQLIRDRAMTFQFTKVLTLFLLYRQKSHKWIINWLKLFFPPTKLRKTFWFSRISQDKHRRQQSDFDEFEAETKRNNWKKKKSRNSSQTAMGKKKENVSAQPQTHMQIANLCVDVRLCFTDVALRINRERPDSGET